MQVPFWFVAFGSGVPLRQSGVIAGLVLAACVGTATPSRAQQGLSHAEEPALSKDPAQRIDQDKLLNGDYALRRVIEIGRHLFSTPFTKAEGYGEGGRIGNDGKPELGPRAQSFQCNLKAFGAKFTPPLTVDELRTTFNFPPPVLDPKTKEIVFPYMRLNGLDSQSCFECHNSIGSERLSDTASHALTRKQSTIGGPAGFASNALINPNLPIPIFMFIRNPPHVFGTGYAQELAEEMTQDLLYQQSTALRQALDNPGNKAEVALESKGTSFGTFAATYTGNVNNKPPLDVVIKAVIDKPCQNVLGFNVDCSKVEGVSPDLVVRPFQWKGIASNERNFVRDALDFHFGMEAREKNDFFDEGAKEVHDGDKDGIPDEMTLGDVSALTIYTMTIRPPFEVKPETEKESRSVEKGRRIFTGKEQFTEKVSCARCHTPSLLLNDSMVVVRDPRKDRELHGPVRIVAANKAGLSSQVESSLQLPSVRRYLALKPTGLAGGIEALRLARSSHEASYATDSGKRKNGYAFDLTTLRPADPKEHAGDIKKFSETQPRLPTNGTTIEVPIFSDLRRHKMGKGLKERDGFQQTTDSMAIPGVPEDQFLTRPLWGVADTGPWLHDGRAQSLKEAILLHRSEGSEANDVIDAFDKLTDGEKQDLINFLLTFRLPIDRRYAFEEIR